MDAPTYIIICLENFENGKLCKLLHSCGHLIQVGFNTKDQDEFTQDVRDNVKDLGASQVNVYPLQKKSALYFEFVGAPRPTFKKAMADSSGADSPSAQRPPRYLI
ncbi:hypothetical protein HPP92_004676 [Vanilla planifolia]|uniref:Uncharacterized protein n=1 Tax=Vanilla planifolia TaxID=51239 RepID=A0A835RIV0_VANPL|nr:hypothetical protein HPP92_004676 [Vanilla planifolia]